MTGEPLRRLLDLLRRRTDPDATGPAADDRLLARIVASGDPTAFEMLVWRHAALVFGTCRRVLGDVHAAEDAFQATFLALARKPRAVRNGAALAGWLHRVAVRIANKLRAQAQRRRTVEQSAARNILVESDRSLAADISRVVDEEIDRLPDRLRRAVVLCYLEDRTTEQAAQILGCPRGTVLSRLAAARERLRRRLSDRGLSLPAAGLTAALFVTESPAGLIAAAVRAALGGASPILIGLVQGVFHAMLMTKVKLATAAVFGIALIGTGIGWIVVPQSGPALVRADVQSTIFQDKVLFLTYRSDRASSTSIAVVSNAVVSLLSDRPFIRGKPRDGFRDIIPKGRGLGEQEIWIPISEIVSVRVYQDDDKSD